MVANKFTPVNNPYASTLDLIKIAKSDTDRIFFYVYDPNLGIGSTYGYGAFQALSWNGNSQTYEATPGQGSYIAPFNSPPNLIQSGQAFWVNSTTVTKAISLDETSKRNCQLRRRYVIQGSGAYRQICSITHQFIWC